MSRMTDGALCVIIPQNGQEWTKKLLETATLTATGSFSPGVGRAFASFAAGRD
jgi:hypothetical protein